MNSKIEAQIDKLSQVSEQSYSTQSAAHFQQLDLVINLLQNQAREEFQQEAIAQYGSVLRKLEAGDPLSGEEYAALEMLIVGRAKYYLKEETDFNSWMGELKRLVAEIEQLKGSGDKSLEGMLELQALCIDAGRVVSDITFYLEEKERYERFRESTHEIDLDESAMLATMIRSMLGSGTM
ncbi:MAG TPA: hypothetical protein VI776_11655 [Anaerolineales bacterium]|nr:hypothetical protein [Anaerolineales bacterium]